ncbi:hypothetical protein EDD22DRAFT_973541 [Suillus occidentalis]|nr:hypothetical protein EDD22DRAFT_973541 [Suillus occidentalis]
MLDETIQCVQTFNDPLLASIARSVEPRLTPQVTQESNLHPTSTKLTLSFALATLSRHQCYEVLVFFSTCVKAGIKVPDVGPNLAACKSLHIDTLGSDTWWRKAESQTVRISDILWFPEDGLNASYNYFDRWAFKHPNRADEPKGGYLVTCPELLREVCSIANALKALDVKKGDTICISARKWSQHRQGPPSLNQIHTIPLLADRAPA